jgi:serine/threonine-protein kinase
MCDETRVEQLLDELVDSDLTPEQVCADCPEYLAEVRSRREQMRRVEAELDVLFPHSTLDPDADSFAALDLAAELPDIPGYQVDAVIGRGGMGIVYQARHLRLNRTVALKTLRGGPLAGHYDRQRFFREAEAVAALRHPNVVQLYDMGDVDGRPYFTMELVEGGSLRAKIAGTPQPAALAASLTAALAGAVHVAHLSGIVHRDLKPANVLLTADGTPKVTDFGLAWRLEDEEGLTQSGVLMGTPSYMAPEQARGDKSAIGPATDVYALGAILYELLTGRPPFRADTATATLRQVAEEEPVSPSRLNSRVPRDLETICLKCLQKGPSERYASAAALGDDLRRFERGEPIAARPPGALERSAKWVRRRPATAALVASALLMLGGVGSAAVWYAGDRARLRAEARSRDREANAALVQAELQLEDLRTKLDDPFKVRELLSDIDRWQAMVQQARQNWQQAVSASVGEEVRVAAETRDRIQAVQAAVRREEAAYELGRELDNIAVKTLASFDTTRSKERKAVAEYDRSFARQGLDVHQPGTEWFASAIRSSPVRFALIAALDNWALLAARIIDPTVARLLELTRAADPDPWRDRFRDPAVWADREALTRLAKEVDVRRQSPTVLISLVWWLRVNGADPTALIELILLDHPRDFWLHLNAAVSAMEPGVKVGLAHAALAIRPASALAYSLLASYLRERGDSPEAVVAAKRAIALDPNYATSHYFLGLALRDTKDLPGAVVAFKRAAELESGMASPLWNLGDLFLLQGDEAVAVDAYRKATDRYCTYAAFWKLGGCSPDLKLHLRNLKEQPKVIAALRRAIALDSGDFLVRYLLGQILQQQGRYAEAEQAYLGAIHAQPAWVPACDSLARLLATCPDEKIRDGKRAIKYARTACERTRWEDLCCADSLAAAYAEAGQFDEAVRYQTRALEDPILRGTFRTAAGRRLELYRQKKPFRDQLP